MKRLLIRVPDLGWALGLALGLSLVCAGSSLATDTTDHLTVSKSPGGVLYDPGTPDGREGGETVFNAFAISALPFSDTGNTCDNINDYDEACPYTGSTAPDVVYAYTPSTDEALIIDLCFSSYDTKIYIYCEGPGALVGCNDDYYFGPPCFVYSSALNVLVFADLTYYIVIDGYGEACGDYLMEITGEPPPTPIECPDNGLPENEPPLVDYYIDNWNGGCNSTPPVFTAIHWVDLQTHCALFCGVSGWYYNFASYRDTDWFSVTAGGFEMSFEVHAEQSCNMYVLNTDCNNVVVLYSANTGGIYGSGQIDWPTNPGDQYWLWVGPDAFSGPVNEFNYLMTVCGHIYDLVPAESVTWGGVKAQFR